MRAKSAARPKTRDEKRPAPYLTRETKNIERRFKTYYAVLDIPMNARHAFEGKTKFVKSLKTDSPARAEKKAALIIARWRRQIDKARGENVESLLDFYKRQLSAEEIEAIREIQVIPLKDGSTVEIDTATGERVNDTAVPVKPGDLSEPFFTFGDDKSEKPHRTFARRKAPKLPSTFNSHVTDWHADSRVTQKTKDMQAADIKEFAAEFRSIDKVEKAEVKRWVSDKIADGITPKTMLRKLSALRGYWKYLQSVEHAPDALEPFSGLNISTTGGRVRREDKRQPFEPRDVVKLLNAARKAGDADLADLIDLDRWTGMRIEEVCSLRTEDAKLSAKIPHFTINAGKTDAAIREVPIHPKLVPVVKRLVADSADGWLMTLQPENKYHDRSNALGKRFGRLKTELGFGDNYVFHSIRKTVATQFENATPSIPENVAADIIGHDKPTMTYGLYSGGTSLAVRYEAIKLLRYPAKR